MLENNVEKLSYALFNYNVSYQSIEILLDGEVKFGDYRYVDSLLIFQKLDTLNFFFTELLNIESSTINTFCQLIFTGNVSLVRSFNIKSKEPNYRASHDVGDKEVLITQEDLYYLKLEDAAHYVALKGRKQLMRLFNHRPEIKNFIKKNRIRYDSEFDLIKLAQYCESN